jgi:hypothetical protein
LQLGLSSVLRQRPSCAANLAQPFIAYVDFNVLDPEAKELTFASRLGSKDSNLNFRIQSAMFYH